jgi:hypothetical protein
MQLPCQLCSYPLTKGIYQCVFTLCMIEWHSNKFGALGLRAGTHTMHQHGAGREYESQFGA